MDQPQSAPVETARKSRWSALAALYVALLLVKPLYSGVILIVPWLVRYFVRNWEEALGITIGDYSFSALWLIGFLLLTVLTGILGMRYAREAREAARHAEGKTSGRPPSGKLVLSWVVLDSICFYGVVSKVLRYHDLWCHGFVVVSTILTVLAGHPLLAMRREAKGNVRSDPR